MLSDLEISQRIASQKLIVNADANLIQNCTYSLRVGQIFEPGSGVQFDAPPKSTDGGIQKSWTIGPGECLIIKTLESLNIPNDIGAYYHPLNRLAQKGIMLLNASVIEPGYSGPLSCFLVNFSSRKVEIFPSQEIAKITFEKLDTNLAMPKPKSISAKDYERLLASSACNFEKSFLGVSGIEERAAKSARESVSSSIKWGGVILAFLVIFAQIEPLLSKYLWERIGVTTNTRKVEEAKLLNDLAISQEQLKSTIEKIKDADKQSELKIKISELEAEVKRLKENRKK